MNYLIKYKKNISIFAVMGLIVFVFLNFFTGTFFKIFDRALNISPVNLTFLFSLSGLFVSYFLIERIQPKPKEIFFEKK